MADRLSVIEARLQELDESIARLSRRIDELQASVHEGSTPEATGAARPDRDALAEIAPPQPLRGDATRLVVLIGRTCIVFGGAFLLRALTDSGRVPPSTGVWLGLAYGLGWLAAASRAQGTSALFHGASALAIALPLVLEAATRFRVLSPSGSAIALAVIGLAALAIAWRRAMHGLAGMALLGSVAAALVLAIVLDAWVPFALVLIVLGTAALWLGYARDWPWIAWPPAAAAALAVVAITVRASATPPREDAYLAFAVQAVLIAAYLGSFVLRVVLHERTVGVFEVAQTAVALIVALGGASMVAGARGQSSMSIAIAAMTAGAVLYIQTFGRVAARRGHGRTFYYTGMTALALTLAGLVLLLQSPWDSVTLAVASLAVGLMAWRVGHPMLALQGGITALVAAGQSGLIAFGSRVWFGAFDAWPAIAGSIWVVLAATATALAIPKPARPQGPPGVDSAARVSLAIATAIGLTSLVLTGAGRLILDEPIDRGAAATLGTVVLSSAAIALAALGRVPRFSEVGWLVYPILAAGALKILAADLRLSGPATLFVALAAYGGALIAAPKILKRA